MKRGKEIPFVTDPNYKVVFGAVDNKNPKSLYINISSWGELINNTHDTYEKVINKKRKKIKKHLNEVLSNHNSFYKDKSIVDFNMASSGVSKEKRSFMSVELTLFQKRPLLKVNSEEIKRPLESISKYIISTVFNVDEDFNYHKKKN